MLSGLNGSMDGSDYQLSRVSFTGDLVASHLICIFFAGAPPLDTEAGGK